MTTRGPVPEETLAAIADAIRRPAGPPTFAELVTEFGVSRKTIVKVAEAIGMRDAWEHRRAQTEAATATRAALLAEQRQELELEALEAAREILRRRFESHQVVIKNFGGAEVEDIENGPEDWRNIGQAVNGLTNSATALARLESDLSGAGQASGLLDSFEQALRDNRAAREAASRAGVETVE